MQSNILKTDNLYFKLWTIKSPILRVSSKDFGFFYGKITASKGGFSQ